MNWLIELSLAEALSVGGACVSLAAVVWITILARRLSAPSFEVHDEEGKSALLERELFKTFWRWLSIMGGIVVAVTVSAWFIISAGFGGVARDAANREATAAVSRLSTETDRLRAESSKVLSETRDDRVKVATIVASVASEAGVAAEAAKSAAKDAVAVRTTLEQIKQIESANLATATARAAQSGNVAANVAVALANNASFQKLVTAEALTSLKDIIVASTERCDTLPGGWKDFEKAAGRFILGVGQGVDLSPRLAGESGGKEDISLSIEHIPPHAHALKDFVGMNNGQWRGASVAVAYQGSTPIDVAGDDINRFTGEVGSKGGGESFPHMPPYIALYFCQKEG